jgi:hypothetical protein
MATCSWNLSGIEHHILPPELSAIFYYLRRWSIYLSSECYYKKEGVNEEGEMRRVRVRGINIYSERGREEWPYNDHKKMLCQLLVPFKCFWVVSHILSYSFIPHTPPHFIKLIS